MACTFLGKHECCLTIVDSYLVCGWAGFYERLIMMFMHVEELIEDLNESNTNTLRLDRTFSEGKGKYFLVFDYSIEDNDKI